MLTKRELKWLEERQKLDNPAPCCSEKGPFIIYKEDCKTCNMFVRRIDWCPFATNWRDAAEFESRVARKLAEKISLAMRLAAVKDNDFVMAAEAALMLARLDVEQEKEAEQC